MHDDTINVKIAILGETCQFPLLFCPGPPPHSRSSLFPPRCGENLFVATIYRGQIRSAEHDSHYRRVFCHKECVQVRTEVWTAALGCCWPQQISNLGTFSLQCRLGTLLTISFLAPSPNLALLSTSMCYQKAPMYYRGAGAVLLLYDITNSAVFEDVRGWLEGLSTPLVTLVQIV